MIQFFGEIDRKRGPKGVEQIASEHPAWYLDGHVKELKERIREQQNQLDLDVLKAEHKMIVREELAANKERLATIEASMPTLDEEKRGKLGKAFKEMSGLLAHVLPTRKAGDRKQVDVGKLAATMSTPCIRVGADIASMAVQNGIRVTKDGKMSLNDVSRLHMWSGRLLGDESTPESCRREG